MVLWVYLGCFSESGHARVPTLKNHLLQNNAFVKAFREDLLLPPKQRLGAFARFARLVSYLLAVVVISGLASTWEMGEVYSKHRRRVSCHRGCQFAHFPSLECDQDITSAVRFQGNLYTTFF
mmetsp:Transcript_72604/g.166521  ORF Transcript_72604/g.166521 Transcript_72604/m.166521 type:complete len:122 (+) Transcript_72604:61-426(+)